MKQKGHTAFVYFGKQHQMPPLPQSNKVKITRIAFTRIIVLFKKFVATNGQTAENENINSILSAT